jgi:hypothetical protein
MNCRGVSGHSSPDSSRTRRSPGPCARGPPRPGWSYGEAGGNLDWSAASLRAGRNIRRLCSRHRQAAPPDVDGDLVDYGEIISRFPQVYPA